MRRRPGAAFLVFLLICITWGTIKPNFYLMGWDNFSSYLNPWHNLYNTLFATWREHRGLGVPSDSEIMDLPRQIFNMIAMAVFGMKMADQLYFVATLWGGVLGMYVLGRYIAKLIGQREHTHEWIGFFAAFFYLCNLSTLAVYYYPMVMYNTRFFMLPTTFYILLRAVYDPPADRRTRSLFLLVLIYGMGTYIVATLFITVIIVFGLLFIFIDKKVRVAKLLMIYLLLNSVWLFTFANYSVQKSSVVPTAPTFIVINDSELNKSPSYFSFANQSILRPSFFDAKFTNLNTGNKQSFHPLADQYQDSLSRITLWIWPGLYLSGCLYVLAMRRHRLLLWLVSTALTFLLLSMKEYSPFGQLYAYMIDHVPLASTVFRFGDTKFHAMVAFSGSLIAAITLTQLLEKLQHFTRHTRVKHLYRVLLVIGLICHLFVYRSYFRGELIGFFMYNRIPVAYFSIAKHINSDPENARVIHLPLDRYTYWKPYSWGYYGSAFLHFMLNKPLVDRTFEPASDEMAKLHLRIMDILTKSDEIVDDTLVDVRAERLTRTLQGIGVKYVIDDMTVGSQVDARGVEYWGTISARDSHRVLSRMEQLGVLRVVQRHTIDASKSLTDFSSLYPYLSKPAYITSTPQQIVLYEVINYEKRVTFINPSQTISDSVRQLSSVQAMDILDTHFIEPTDNKLVSLPLFNTKPTRVYHEGGSLLLETDQKLEVGSYLVKLMSNLQKRSMYRIRVMKMPDGYVLRIDSMLLPEIVGVPNTPVFSPSLDIQFSKESEDTHLLINDQSYLIPLMQVGDEQMLGYQLSETGKVNVSLQRKSHEYNISNTLKQLEGNPQCLGDAETDAQSGITGDEGILRIHGANVSNCFTTSIKLQDSSSTVIKGELSFEANSDFTEQPLLKAQTESGKPRLDSYVSSLALPTILDVCAKLPGTSTCLNKERFFSLSGTQKHYVTSIQGNLGGIDELHITFIVKQSQSSRYAVIAKNIFLNTYSSGLPSVFYIPDHVNEQLRLEVPTKIQNTTFRLPYILTARMSSLEGGFWHHKDEGCKISVRQSSRLGKFDDALITYAYGCRVYLMSDFGFSSDRFYLWSVSYAHLSGSRPAIMFADDGNVYERQILLPTYIHPNDYTKVALQLPEFWSSTNIEFKRIINEAKLDSVSGYLYPRPELEDTKSKRVIIDTYANNVSLQKWQDVSLAELPTSWLNLTLSPISAMQTYRTDVDVQEPNRILPSLWKIELRTQFSGRYLLKLNEQYDTQWKILSPNSSVHMRCDGVANCYELTLGKGVHTIYFYYGPEILNMLGLIMSAFVLFNLLVTRKSIWTWLYIVGSDILAMMRNGLGRVNLRPSHMVLAVVWLVFITAQIVRLYNNPLGYDDAYNASVAKNLSLGHGYSTSYDSLKPWNSDITTGPIQIIATSAAISLFGNNIFFPGLVTILLVHITLLFSLISPWTSIRNRSSVLMIFIALQIMLMLYKLDFGYYQLLGEVLATVYFIVGVSVGQNRANYQKKNLIIQCIMFVLAVCTKLILILPIIGYVLGHIILNRHSLSNYIDRSRGKLLLFVSMSIFILAIGFSTKIIPQSIFENGLVFDLPVISDHITQRYRTLLLYFANSSIVFCYLGVIAYLNAINKYKSKFTFPILLGICLHSLWWFLFSKENWIRHIFPSIILFSFIISYYWGETRNKSIKIVLLVLFFVVPLISVSGQISNFFRFDSSKSDDLLATSRYVSMLKSNGSRLYGCGWWWSNRELEYVMPSVLNFSNFLVQSHLPPLSYFVRSSNFDWDNIPACNNFKAKCEQNIVFRQGEFTVSKCM